MGLAFAFPLLLQISQSAWKHSNWLALRHSVDNFVTMLHGNYNDSYMYCRETKCNRGIFPSNDLFVNGGRNLTL